MGALRVNSSSSLASADTMLSPDGFGTSAFTTVPLDTRDRSKVRLVMETSAMV
jgi:hypothetical protein